MPYRTTVLTTGEYYHLYNRGVAYQPVYRYKRDYDRFILTLNYYRFSHLPLRLSKLLQLNNNLREQHLESLHSTGEKIVEVITYCLMPNHFHLLMKQTQDGGISRFLRLAVNSYAKFFNTKYKRAGSLFQDMFKAVHIESDEQLIHVSRYIHLNPLVSGLVRRDKFLDFPWSSLKAYINGTQDDFINPEIIMTKFKQNKDYLQFVLDQEDYGRQLEQIKHLIMEEV